MQGEGGAEAERARAALGGRNLPSFGTINTRLSNGLCKYQSYYHVTGTHCVLTVDRHGDLLEGAASNKLRINISV